MVYAVIIVVYYPLIGNLNPSMDWEFLHIERLC